MTPPPVAHRTPGVIREAPATSSGEVWRALMSDGSPSTEHTRSYPDLPKGGWRCWQAAEQGMRAGIAENSPIAVTPLTQTSLALPQRLG